MNRYAASSVCAVLAGCLFGCGSTYQVRSEPGAEESLNAFNIDAYDRSGTIALEDGREVDARNVRVTPDSTYFMGGKSRAAAVVPFRSVRTVVFKNHVIGFLEGFGIGAFLGAGVGLALGSSSKGGAHSGLEIDAAGIALIFGAAGALLGGVPGSLIGHSYEYQFVPSVGDARK